MVKLSKIGLSRKSLCTTLCNRGSIYVECMHGCVSTPAHTLPLQTLCEKKNTNGDHNIDLLYRYAPIHIFPLLMSELKLELKLSHVQCSYSSRRPDLVAPPSGLHLDERVRDRGPISIGRPFPPRFQPTTLILPWLDWPLPACTCQT